MSTLELSQSGPGSLRMPAGTAELPDPPVVSSSADTAIRASTAAVVLAVAGIAAYISYWHAYAVVRQYGESGVTALLEPGTIEGLVYASSIVILHAARHRLPVPRLARWMLALGIAASLAGSVGPERGSGPSSAASSRRTPPVCASRPGSASWGPVSGSPATTVGGGTPCSSNAAAPTTGTG
jgi:hypothetical protein